MNAEELARLRHYYYKLDAAQGDMLFLSPGECRDLRRLLQEHLEGPQLTRHLLKEIIILAVTGGLLIGYSLDLLYLYFAHAWREPILPILWFELALMGLTPIYAVWVYIRAVKRLGGYKHADR